METVAIVLAVFDIIVCITLVLLVVFQEGNSQGMGIIGGGADTFFGKEKGRSIDSKLKKFTTFLAALFAIVTISLYLVLTHGF